jgi:hypothetical protein
VPEYGPSPLETKMKDFLRAQRAEALLALNNQLSEHQKSCKHLHVAHWDGHNKHSDGSLMQPQHPRRICMDCGLEEEGGWWCYSPDCPHWHARETSAGVLGGTVVLEEQAKRLKDVLKEVRIIRPVTYEKFAEQRAW